MDIFDKLLNDDRFIVEGPKEDPDQPQRKRKMIGMKREKRAVNYIRQNIHAPKNLLHSLCFIHPETGEECEVDALYVGDGILCIVEIKSKNFEYLYGNTDTGHWFLRYGGKMVKSDNPFRQISRQIRIMRANLQHDGHIIGIVFLNNRHKDVTVDIIGPQIRNLRLMMDVHDVIDVLNKLEPCTDQSFINKIMDIDENNRYRKPRME